MATKIASILICAGDVGGARSLLPVIDELAKNKLNFKIIDHGYLGNTIAKSNHRHSLIEHDLQKIQKLFVDGNIRVYLFATSVKDDIALKWARYSQVLKIITFCLLDSAIRIAHRMNLDGNPRFAPDRMFLQDDVASKCAIREGFDPESLIISGQPALSKLSNDHRKWSLQKKQKMIFKNQWMDERKLRIFVSEPVKQDQGDSTKSASFRGYTEEQVISLMCKHLGRSHKKIQIGILPHPRENRNGLFEIFNLYCSKLKCEIINCDNSRDAILASDGVIGMASILLYEAWLIGKPVMSLQPNIINDDFRYLENKQKLLFINNEKELRECLPLWMNPVLSSHKKEIKENLRRRPTFPQGDPEVSSAKCRLTSGFEKGPGVTNTQ